MGYLHICTKYVKQSLWCVRARVMGLGTATACDHALGSCQAQAVSIQVCWEVLHPLPLPLKAVLVRHPGHPDYSHTPVPTGWMDEKPFTSSIHCVIPLLFGRDQCLCGLCQLAVPGKQHLRTALSNPCDARAPRKGAAFRLQWVPVRGWCSRDTKCNCWNRCG